ncbi:MAG: hypothetical protein J2P54_22325, partial [Bradyrhizobiaceae bacterium]|nr:hypothetical protein [Bradyrhizobiaceae bacterium]
DDAVFANRQTIQPHVIESSSEITDEVQYEGCQIRPNLGDMQGYKVAVAARQGDSRARRYR